MLHQTHLQNMVSMCLASESCSVNLALTDCKIARQERKSELVWKTNFPCALQAATGGGSEAPPQPQQRMHFSAEASHAVLAYAGPEFVLYAVGNALLNWGVAVAHVPSAAAHLDAALASHALLTTTIHD